MNSRLGVLDCQATREKMQLKKAANGRISDFVALMKESSLHLAVPDKSESSEKPFPTVSYFICDKMAVHTSCVLAPGQRLHDEE